jgi:hypothetical protein
MGMAFRARSNSFADAGVRLSRVFVSRSAISLARDVIRSMFVSRDTPSS